MGDAYLILRLALAAVLATAALGKLASLERTRASLARFAVPEPLLVPASVSLIAVELALAALLVPPATARIAAIAAAALMLVFSLAIARAIARGEHPDCNCFGQIHSSPVGYPTVVRNLIIGAVAVAIAAGGPGNSIAQALKGVDALAAVAVALLIAVLAGLMWFTVELFRQNGRLLERVDALERAAASTPRLDAAGSGPVLENAGTRQPTHSTYEPLPVGSPAPTFTLPDLGGIPRTLQDLLPASRPLLLAFIDPDCGACWSVLRSLERLRSAREGELEFAIISRGAPELTLEHLSEPPLGAVLLQQHREVALAFGVPGVPSVVLLSPDGRTASPMASGPGAVERLFGDQAGPQQTPAGRVA